VKLNSGSWNLEAVILVSDISEGLVRICLLGNMLGGMYYGTKCSGNNTDWRNRGLVYEKFIFVQLNSRKLFTITYHTSGSKVSC